MEPLPLDGISPSDANEKNTVLTELTILPFDVLTYLTVFLEGDVCMMTWMTCKGIKFYRSELVWRSTESRESDRRYPSGGLTKTDDMLAVRQLECILQTKLVLYNPLVGGERLNTKEPSGVHPPRTERPSTPNAGATVSDRQSIIVHRHADSLSRSHCIEMQSFDLYDFIRIGCKLAEYRSRYARFLSDNSHHLLRIIGFCYILMNTLKNISNMRAFFDFETVDITGAHKGRYHIHHMFSLDDRRISGVVTYKIAETLGMKDKISVETKETYLGGGRISPDIPWYIKKWFAISSPKKVQLDYHNWCESYFLSLRKGSPLSKWALYREIYRNVNQITKLFSDILFRRYKDIATECVCQYYRTVRGLPAGSVNIYPHSAIMDPHTKKAKPYAEQPKYIKGLVGNIFKSSIAQLLRAASGKLIEIYPLRKMDTFRISHSILEVLPIPDYHIDMSVWEYKPSKEERAEGDMHEYKGDLYEYMQETPALYHYDPEDIRRRLEEEIAEGGSSDRGLTERRSSNGRLPDDRDASYREIFGIFEVYGDPRGDHNDIVAMCTLKDAIDYRHKIISSINPEGYVVSFGSDMEDMMTKKQNITTLRRLSYNAMGDYCSNRYKNFLAELIYYILVGRTAPNARDASDSFRPETSKIFEAEPRKSLINPVSLYPNDTVSR